MFFNNSRKSFDQDLIKAHTKGLVKRACPSTVLSQYQAQMYEL